jgi:hypothetical protein
MSADPEQGHTPTEQTPALQPGESETSLVSRFVTILTPIFVVAAGWIAGLVAKHVPGANLDQTQIVTFMTAAATAVLVVVWKWLQGWQQHEALVAQGKATARKTGAAPLPLVTTVPSSQSAQTSVGKLDTDVAGLKKSVNELHAGLDQLTKGVHSRVG